MWEARWTERVQEIISHRAATRERRWDGRVKRRPWLCLQSEMQAGVLWSELYMQPQTPYCYPFLSVSSIIIRPQPLLLFLY